MESIILLVFVGLFIIIFLIQQLRLDKEIFELNDKSLDLSFKSLKMLNEINEDMNEIRTILKNADEKRENYTVTLNKIKRVVS